MIDGTSTGRTMRLRHYCMTTKIPVWPQRMPLTCRKQSIDFIMQKSVLLVLQKYDYLIVTNLNIFKQLFRLITKTVEFRCFEARIYIEKLVRTRISYFRNFRNSRN